MNELTNSKWGANMQYCECNLKLWHCQLSTSTWVSCWIFSASTKAQICSFGCQALRVISEVRIDTGACIGRAHYRPLLFLTFYSTVFLWVYPDKKRGSRCVFSVRDIMWYPLSEITQRHNIVPFSAIYSLISTLWTSCIFRQLRSKNEDEPHELIKLHRYTS